MQESISKQSARQGSGIFFTGEKKKEAVYGTKTTLLRYTVVYILPGMNNKKPSTAFWCVSVCLCVYTSEGMCD